MYNFMEQISAKVKKWGNSFGIVLPMPVVEKENLKEGSDILLIIQSRNKTKVKDVFGILKGKIKKPTQQIMDEINEELWEEE